MLASGCGLDSGTNPTVGANSSPGQPGTGGEGAGDEGAGSSGPTFPVGSWMYVWTEALQVCTICHSKTPASPRCGVEFACPPKGVVLTADNYAGVVNGEEVEPFRPENSKLWERVTDPDPAKRMPLDLPELTPEQLGIIRDWIVDGAPECPANQVCP